MNKELVIEKLNVDVFAGKQTSNNGFLLEINETLQKTILPKLEKKLKPFLNDELAIQLDQLSLDWTTPKTENWSADFAEALSEKIIAKIVERQEEIKADHSTRDDLPNWIQWSERLELPMEEPQEGAEGVYVFLRFLQTGYLVQSSFNSLDDLVNNFSSNISPHQSQIIAQFLLKHEQAFNRYACHCSSQLHEKILAQHCPDDWSAFLAEIAFFHSKKYENDQKWLRFGLKMIETQENNLLEKAQEQKEALLPAFYQFLKEKQILTRSAQSASTKKGQIESSSKKPINQLMKSFKTDAPSALNLWFKKQSPEIQQFIQYLQLDPLLKGPLNQHLLNQAENHPGSFHSFQTWQNHFVQNMSSYADLTQLLLELEDYQPLSIEIRNQITGHEKAIYQEQMKNLVNALEKRMAEQSSEAKTETVSAVKKSPTAAKNALEKEAIIAPNSGVVLLHPFLPQLFRTLNLLNKKYEWRSSEAQIKALFAIHYLGSKQTKNITEDQLIMPKLLTGMAIDEELPNTPGSEGYSPFSTKDGALFLTNLTTEMENVLEAIHENWRPMRNCTWPGLRADFLNRPGTLQLKNEQLILKIEPHTFDILLPHKNWGHSMVKFSWMDMVVYVEWGE